MVACSTTRNPSASHAGQENEHAASAGPEPQHASPPDAGGHPAGGDAHAEPAALVVGMSARIAFLRRVFTTRSDARIFALARRHGRLFARIAKLPRDVNRGSIEWEIEQACMEELCDLEAAVIDARAKTIDGIRMKARIFFLASCEFLEQELAGPGSGDGCMLASLIRDLLGDEGFAEVVKERDLEIACERIRWEPTA